jgi:hypothetical protein
MYHSSKVISFTIYILRTPQLECEFGENAMALTAEQNCGTYRNFTIKYFVWDKGGSLVA